MIMRNKLILTLIINIVLSFILVSFNLYKINFDNKINNELSSLNSLVKEITDFNKLFSEENVDLEKGKSEAQTLRDSFKRDKLNWDAYNSVYSNLEKVVIDYADYVIKLEKFEDKDKDVLESKINNINIELKNLELILNR